MKFKFNESYFQVISNLVQRMLHGVVSWDCFGKRRTDLGNTTALWGRVLLVNQRHTITVNLRNIYMKQILGEINKLHIS